MKFLNEIRIPRCYFRSTPVEVQVHGFSDASNSAYAAVLYLRSVYDDGRILVRLVASKSRVAPIKKQTIPRLELLGTVLLARLVNKFTSAIKSLISINWTDSTTALCWIQNERIWKQYVQHRVEEIRSLTHKQLWRHCPGELNPADIPSRGQNAEKLSLNSMWWNGPSFLNCPETEWPKIRIMQEETEHVLQEAKRNTPEITHSMVNASSDESATNLWDIIDSTRYSSLMKLLRVTAFVMKFISNFMNRSKTKQNRDSVKVEVNASNINDAEVLWIKSIQANSFGNEIRYLKRKTTECITEPKYVKQFGLYLDERGIIRCRGRIGNSTLSPNCKYPILLPSKHHFVTLLIEHTHKFTVLHDGIRDTLTALRDRFWIIRGHESVKSYSKVRYLPETRRYILWNTATDSFTQH